MFAEHAVGGIVGLVFNALFGEGWIIALDGVNAGYQGGWVQGNWAQLYKQVAYIVACCAYTFVMSAIIAKLIDFVPGLKLRASEQAELLGLDDDQHGEFAYDYVEVRRDYLAWTPAEKEQRADGETVIPQHGIEAHAAMAQATNGANTPAEQPEPTEKAVHSSSS